MPISGGVGGQFSSARIVRITAVSSRPARVEASRQVRGDNQDQGTIVNHANTVVGYIGGGQYQIQKNGGTSGTFDADAVSGASISGDAEVIIDWASGTFVAGLQYAALPTANSGYGTIIGAYMDGAQTAMFSFGSQVGAVHAWQPYAKIAYTAADDTVRFYTSSDRLNWGSALESVASIGSPALYFDSSLSTGSFNVVFDVPAAVSDISGTTSLAFAASGALAGQGALSATSSLVLAPSGTLAGKGAVTGSSTLVLSSSGTITGKGAVSGSSALALSAAGAVSGLGAVSGASSVIFAPAGALTGLGDVSGSSSVVFDLTGSVTSVGGTITLIDGSSNLTFASSGSLFALVAIAGSTTLKLSLSGGIRGVNTMWADDPDFTGTWTEEPMTGAWTPEPANDGAWSDDAAATGTWTDVPGSWT